MIYNQVLNFDQEKFGEIPLRFSDFGYEYSDFINNAGPMFLFIAWLVSLLPIYYFLKFLKRCIKWKRFNSLVTKI